MNGRTRIRAVLFDLYETLVTERDTPPTRASSLGTRFGLDATQFRKAWKPHRPKVVRGERSFADALLQVGSTLGHQLDVTAVQSACEERRLETVAVFERFDPEAVTMLHELRNRGLKLAVVSNCFAEDVEGWPRCSGAPCFDTSVFSCEVGAAKPEPLSTSKLSSGLASNARRLCLSATVGMTSSWARSGLSSARASDVVPR
jgi:FMN phosphatase YigB (HAD superfamily)